MRDEIGRGTPLEQLCFFACLWARAFKYVFFFSRSFIGGQLLLLWGDRCSRKAIRANLQRNHNFFERNERLDDIETRR